MFGMLYCEIYNNLQMKFRETDIFFFQNVKMHKSFVW